jgi:hypothetical protein
MAKLHSPKEIADFDTINSGLTALEPTDFQKPKPRIILPGERLLDELTVWKRALQVQTLKTEFFQK